MQFSKLINWKVTQAFKFNWWYAGSAKKLMFPD